MDCQLLLWVPLVVLPELQVDTFCHARRLPRGKAEVCDPLLLTDEQLPGSVEGLVGIMSVNIARVKLKEVVSERRASGTLRKVVGRVWVESCGLLGAFWSAQGLFGEPLETGKNRCFLTPEASKLLLHKHTNFDKLRVGEASRD